MVRHTVLPTSSAIRNAPVLSTASPTTRPRLIFIISGYDILRHTARLAVAERRKDYLVAAQGIAIPATMLADKRPHRGRTAVRWLYQTPAPATQQAGDTIVNVSQEAPLQVRGHQVYPGEPNRARFLDLTDLPS